MNTVIDFPAARRRLESRAEHSIEIDARAIPFVFEFVPTATLRERMTATLTDAQFAELVTVALAESL